MPGMTEDQARAISTKAVYEQELRTLNAHWPNLLHNNVYISLRVECFNCRQKWYADVKRFYDLAQELRRAGWSIDRLHTWWCPQCRAAMPKYVEPDGD